jgi:hypothetical protein
MAKKKPKPKAKAKPAPKRKPKAAKATKPAAPAKPGRPSSYDPSMCAVAEKLTRLLGATDHDVAEFFGVCDRTLNRWKLEHEEFCQSLKLGKEVSDQRVEKSLYQRAIGFRHDAVKIMQHNGAPVIVPYTEQVPPDTTACIFWLKNRKQDEWRDKIEHAGDPLRPVQVTLNLAGKPTP